MPGTAPHLETVDTPQGATVRLLGVWNAVAMAQPGRYEPLQHELLALHRREPGTLTWDLRDMERLDHVGAQRLWNLWGQHWPQHLLAQPVQQAMLAHVARYSGAPERPGVPDLMARLTVVGQQLLLLAGHGADALRMVGQLALDLLRLLRAPREAPWRDFCGHLYRMGATALPITALVGFLIGVVLAYLMAQQLRRFGADAFIVNILGLALMRELGPVLAAILVAGRSGSAITAQIGVMRVTEELDAMRVMGIAHGMRLVLPRALALAVAMPLISAWTTAWALAGGMLATDMVLGIPPQFFIDNLPASVQAVNLLLASGKSVVFGLMIALVGCHFGLRVQPNTDSLGRGTTASVVTAITMVLTVDALFAVVFKDVGL